MLRRHILAAAGATLAAPAIVSRGALGQNPRKVKMGSAFTTTTNAAFLMPALLKPEGIDLELVMFPSLVQRMQADAWADFCQVDSPQAGIKPYRLAARHVTDAPWKLRNSKKGKTREDKTLDLRTGISRNARPAHGRRHRRCRFSRSLLDRTGTRVRRCAKKMLGPGSARSRRRRRSAHGAGAFAGKFRLC